MRFALAIMSLLTMTSSAFAAQADLDLFNHLKQAGLVEDNGRNPGIQANIECSTDSCFINQPIAGSENMKYEFKGEQAVNLVTILVSAGAAKDANVKAFVLCETDTLRSGSVASRTTCGVQ